MVNYQTKKSFLYTVSLSISLIWTFNFLSTVFSTCSRLFQKQDKFVSSMIKVNFKICFVDIIYMNGLGSSSEPCETPQII